MGFTNTKQPCPSCGSSDALAHNDDGSSKCFSCGTFHKGDRTNVSDNNDSDDHKLVSRGPTRKRQHTPSIKGECIAIPDRCIREETCRKFGYRTDELGEQFAPYYLDGKITGSKRRSPGKRFSVVGDISESGLFGEHLWPNEGKRLVITEGELDAMTISQCTNLSWPVVSIKNGAQAAAKDIRNSYDFVSGYEEVVLAFDNDEAGRKAIKEVIPLLTNASVKIATYGEGFKDANALLKAGNQSDVQKCIYNAKTHQPDGIVAGKDLIGDLMKHYDGLLFPHGLDLTNFPGLNEQTRGVRKGELWTFIAGTGCGKSTLVHEIGFDLWKNHGKKIAIIALEETKQFAALRYVSLLAKKRLRLDPKSITKKRYKECVTEVLDNEDLWFYDHGGNMKPDVILERINYFARALGVDFVIFDHISMSIASTSEGNETRLVDNVVTKLRSVVDSTGIGCLLISHVRKAAQGVKTAEEGGRMKLSDIRGSAVIQQESDFVIGIERDTQSPDDTTAHIRILKNRFTGENGEADSYTYDRDSGLLVVTKTQPKNAFQTPTKEIF